MAGRNLFEAETPKQAEGQNLFPDLASKKEYSVGEQIAGAIPTIVRGALAEVPAGLAEVGTAITSGTSEGRKAGERVRQVITGTPSEAGQAGLENLSELVNYGRNLPIVKPALDASIPAIEGDFINEQLTKAGLPEEVVAPIAALPQASLEAIGVLLSGGLLNTTAKSTLKAAESAGGAVAQIPGKVAATTGDLVLSGAQKASTGIGKAVEQGKKLLPSELERRSNAFQAFQRGETRNKDTAGFRIEDGRVRVDDIEQDVLDNGFDPVLVTSLRDANQATKNKAGRILDNRDSTERGMVDEGVGARRGADIVGQSLRERFEFLNRQINKAKVKRSRALKELEGKQIDLKPVTDNFVNRLDEYGIKYARNADGSFNPSGDLDFGDSVFALNKKAQNKIQEFVSSLASAGKVDAKKAHNYKLGIDDMVGYGKDAADGITGEVEDFMKGFRHDINQAIRQVSTDYADANDVMSEIIDTVKEANRLIGKNYNPSDRQFGLLSRTILTNYKQGDNVNDLIAEMNALTTKYGGKFDDNIVTLTRLYTDLNKVIKSEAPGSLEGILQGSMKNTASTIAQKEFNAMQRKNRFTAIDSMRQLINRPVVPGTEIIPN